MKRLITLTALMMATSAFAWGHYGYRGGYYHGYGYGGWVAPALIGGAIGYGIASTPVYAAPPVVVTPPPVVYTQPAITAVQPNCSAWTEIRNPDGSVTTQRTCQ
jgi:hypothetical protein